MGKEMGFHNGHAGSICEGGSALYSSCEGSSQVGVAHETSMSMTYLSRLERQAHLTRQTISDKRPRRPTLAFTVLSKLDLLRESADGVSVASRELKELFAEAYYKRREQHYPR
jgi:hypothetical protein